MVYFFRLIFIVQVQLVPTYLCFLVGYKVTIILHQYRRMQIFYITYCYLILFMETKYC